MPCPKMLVRDVPTWPMLPRHCAVTFITIYLTWSPWHYSGQNYGIALMMLRRRGVDPSPLAKRALHWSFYLSFGAVLLNFHFEGGLGMSDPLGYAATASSGYSFVSLELPGELRGLLMPVIGLAYFVSVALALGLLLRDGAGSKMIPSALIVLIQGAWFSIPHLGYYFSIGENIPVLNLRDGADFQAYFVWVALGHAIQYVWITAYYARNDPRWRGYGLYLTKAVTFGNAVWAAPLVLLSPDIFRGAEYDSGLAISVAAAVNLHHFILDGAIWKLRNPKISAVLLRTQDGEGAVSPTSGVSPWVARAAWTGIALLFALKVVPYVEIDGRFPAALQKRDYEGAAAILDRAAWYGRDSSQLRADLANQMVREGKAREALPHFWRSLDLHPSNHGYLAVGTLTERLLGPQRAMYAFEQGLELYPEDVALIRGKALVMMKSGQAREAVAYLERVLEAEPEDAVALEALELVRERLGDDAS